MSYDEYGRLGAGSVSTGQPFRYTGRRFDEETGLYYYRARYYSPVLGRFLQTDPSGYHDDLNLYAYVGNDPVNFNDPRGLFSTSAHNKMIDHALSDRLNGTELALVKGGSKWADSKRNQAADRSFMHSMRANGAVVQSARDAIRARNEHIARTLEAAKKANAEGKRNLALLLFGVAIHAEMDATSPEHVDESGDPIVWRKRDFWGHGWGDIGGDRFGCNECADDVTQKLLDYNAMTIQSAFLYVFEQVPRGTVIITLSAIAGFARSPMVVFGWSRDDLNRHAAGARRQGKLLRGRDPDGRRPECVARWAVRHRAASVATSHSPLRSACSVGVQSAR